MRKINVLNKKGLAACIASTTKDESRGSYTYILIEPNGTCVGLDGHRMVVSENCVEAFEGERLFLKVGKVSASQTNNDSKCTIIVDDDDARLVLTHRDKKPTTLVYVEIPQTCTFPPYEDLKAEPCENMNVFKVQFSLVSDIEKILNHGIAVTGIKFSQSGDYKSKICVEFDGDANTLLTLMPMKF